MNGFVVFLLVVLAIAVAILIFIGGTWVVVWNINDMINVGVNFWNTFWVLLVGTVFFGGAAKAGS